MATWFAVLLFLCAAQLRPALGQGLPSNGVCTAAFQPVLGTLFPPAGTTGLTADVSTTNYTITGDMLDQVSTVSVLAYFERSNETLRTGNRVGNSTFIGFNIDDARLREREVVNATVFLVPQDPDCITLTINIKLHARLRLSFEARSDEAQPGTVVFVTSESCAPGECGDNSTNFDLIIGGLMLESLNTSGTTLRYAGRFPNFQQSIPEASVQIVTDYQTFQLDVFFEFELNLPPPITVTPTSGQRGTFVNITGSGLIGPGAMVAISRVRLGETETEFIVSSDSVIQVRARSGIPGIFNVRINTTDTFDEVPFDGPYLSLVNGWTQLMDGNITEIIPRAAQAGRNITLCGENLLGNGNRVSTIQHGPNTQFTLQSLPSPPILNVSASECLTAQIPQDVQGVNESFITITSDTGSTVLSAFNFTIATIASITPNRGQTGTIVTIRGQGLLSGYSDVTPAVFLSDTPIRLMSYSNAEIVGRTNTPIDLPPTVINETTGATEAPEIFGVMGSIVIEVIRSDTTFTVSNSTGWQYERPGAIDAATPDFGQFGTVISISGTNLLAYGNLLTHAMIGSANATVLDGATDTLVRLVVPDSSMTGFVNVVLFSDTGASIRGIETFVYRERGVIVRAEPNQGQRGTLVTITGTNLFGHGNNVTSVLFGGVAAVIDYDSSNDSAIVVEVQENSNAMDMSVAIQIMADTSAIVVSPGTFWTYLVQGMVTANQPQEGQVGTRVEITGTNLLGGGTAITEVFLDGVSGTIISESNTRIVVVLSELLTQRGDFFSGQVYIMSDTGAVVTGGTYTHRASGTITRVSPTRGRKGTIVTVIGTGLLGFGTSLDGADIAGVPGMVMSANNTVVILRAGTGMTNQTGPVVLRSNTGATITSSANFIFDEPGIVSSVTPMMGAEGTGVVVSGSGLLPDSVQLTNVTIGGIQVARVVISSNQVISVIVGPAPSENSNMSMIVISASDGSFVDGIFFSFIDLVISVPGLSQGQEGTLVNITLPGVTQFDPSNTFRATIDDQAADVVNVVASERIITVRVPRARRLGMFMVDVTVEANGLIARLRNGFTYLSEGIICVVEPITGQSGTSVTLRGENLLGGGTSIASATVVGQPARVMQGTNTMVVLQLTAPTQQLSYPLRGDIRLMANTGATVTKLSTFELVAPGIIAQVSPQVGQNGTRVELTGTNLLQGTLTITSVTLAGVPAMVTGTPTDTLIAVEAAASAQTQPMPVVIVLSSGATISTGDGLSFSYLIPGQIQSVQPNSGPVGTRVSIRGINLLQGGTMVREVSMAGVLATINSASDTEIAVTVQAGVPGSGDIVVTSNTGSTLVDAELWTYEDLGRIVSVSPTIGQQEFVVSISGEALLSSASGFSMCSLAGIPGRLTGLFSSTSVQCAAGMNPINRMNVTGPVQLMTNTGVIITSPTNITFTYYQAYIDSISPSRGNNGTEVAIRGLNLFTHPDNDSFQVSRVTFGEVEATIVSSSANVIRVLVRFFDNTTSNDTVRIDSSSGSFLELNFAWDYTLPAQIISIDPEFGFPGDMVTLTGENFAATTPSVIIGQTQSFNVVVLNNSTIQFRVGVYQGSDLPGTDLPLQIVYPTGETVFSPNVTFVYNETTMNITSISPQGGQAGAIVTITGTNFPNSSQIMTVRLADVEAVIESLEPDELRVRAGIPDGAGVRGSLAIELTSGLVFGLAGEVWEYYPDIAASSVNPMTGQNGTNVTIDLSSIPNLPTVTRVNLTSTPATILGMADGVLMVRAGVSNSTPSSRITVELAGNIVISIANAWSYQVPVSVTQIVPSSGYFNTSVTITGTGFQAGSVDISSVTLAGFETVIVSQSNTQLMVRITQEVSTPTNVVGPVVIQANSGATYSSILQRNFTYVAVQVNNISPMNGTRGTEVTLTGMGLLAGGNRLVSATMAGIPATLRSASSGMIVFIAGASPADSAPGNITYNVDTGAVVNFPSTWSYREPGEITSVSPSTGAMGTIVSISGRSLLGGGTRVQRVILNSLSTTNILESFDNFVQVVAPGSSTLPSIAGGIQVISDTQAITESNSSAVNFTYLSPGSISSFNPTRGQDGTIVTITGQRFHNGEGISRVLLAGVEARIIRETASTVSVETRRSDRAGSFEGPITIISNNSATVLSTQNFTYITEGTIFVVDPDRGRNGTIVRMEGENIFGGGTSLQGVTLAGERARIINQTSSEVYVEALLRSGDTTASVTGDIVLESITNAQVRRIDGWTYVQQGVITAIAPEEGQYGTFVNITGQNLLSGGSDITSLEFDDVILDVRSASDTRITARIGQPTNTSNFTSDSISLTSNTGGTLYLDYNWNFLSQSSIASLNPPNGFGGNMVIINGENLLGGGTSIRSVTIDGIDGRVMMATDNEVIIITGFNSNGEERMGNLILESDTGALTMATWRYDAECTNNTFGTTGNCIPCDEQCNECDGPTDMNCTACANFAIFQSDNITFQCVQKCPGVSTRDRICVDTCASFQYEQIDTLENATFCDNCSSLCDPNLGCSGPAASQCQSCLYFRDVVNETCIESCSTDSFFSSTKDCIPCDPECSGGCFGPSDADCFECTNFQVDLIALASEFLTLPNTVCRSECPDMFFLDATNNFCLPCDSNCVIGCNGPTPFDCMECRSTFILQNGRQMCTQSCNASSTMQQYYQVQNSAECRLCHTNCLPMAGCTGPDSTDCNVCALSQDSECVSSCSDSSTYFIRNATSECVRCHESCGDGGCSEEGPNNCLAQGSLSAGGGTIAIVIIIILILVAVIVALTVVLAWRLGTRKSKYEFEPNEEVTGNNDSVRYTTRTTTLQTNIPLDIIEKPRSTTNPLAAENYTELGPEEREDLSASYGLVDQENNGLSASQADLYTDMDTIPSSYPQVEEVSASQDVYTDMEPIMLDKGAPAPSLPPKPQEENKKEEKPAPALPPKAELPLPTDTNEKPPIPSKPEKALPPGPPPVQETEAAPELYTDMQGGITEIFVNSCADDVYDDVQSDPALSSSPPASTASPAIDDTYEDTSPIVDDTYEDTDTIMANMELYRKTVSSSNVQVPPRVPAPRPLASNRMSAPALPSQPIPKKKQPVQRTISSTSTVSNPTSPTSSTFSRPESVISGTGIPEEEQLYDDIGAGEPLVPALPARTQSSAKSQPPKKQSKAKSKKK